MPRARAAAGGAAWAAGAEVHDQEQVADMILVRDPHSERRRKGVVVAADNRRSGGQCWRSSQCAPLVRPLRREEGEEDGRRRQAATSTTGERVECRRQYIMVTTSRRAGVRSR